MTFKFIRYPVIAAAVALTAACTKAPVTTVDEQSRMLSEIHSVSRLNLARMAVSKLATVDDIKPSNAATLNERAQAMLAKLKIGTRKAAYSYKTYLVASIDLSRVTADDIAVDPETNTVTLTLPPVSVSVDGRDATLREEHYRVTGLRSQISASERAAVKEAMNSAVMTEIATDPEFHTRLSDKARSKASEFFTNLLGNTGRQVIIRFDEQ